MRSFLFFFSSFLPLTRPPRLPSHVPLSSDCVLFSNCRRIGKHCSIITCRFRKAIRPLATEESTRAYRYNRQKHGHIY